MVFPICRSSFSFCAVIKPGWKRIFMAAHVYTDNSISYFILAARHSSARRVEDSVYKVLLAPVAFSCRVWFGLILAAAEKFSMSKPLLLFPAPAHLQGTWHYINEGIAVMFMEIRLNEAPSKALRGQSRASAARQWNKRTSECKMRQISVITVCPY